MTLPVTDDPTDIEEAWRTHVTMHLREIEQRIDGTNERISAIDSMLRVVLAELQRVAGDLRLAALLAHRAAERLDPEQGADRVAGKT